MKLYKTTTLFFAILLTSFASQIAHADTCLPLENASGAIKNADFNLSYKTEPSKISVSKPFSLHVKVCETGQTPYKANLKLDATMPKHRHGMNFTPKISKQSSGLFLIEGMLLHMPGEWQYKFDLKGKDRKVQLTKDFLLK
ncbi:MAG: FixH family protein [Sneathiella sp.]